MTPCEHPFKFKAKYLLKYFSKHKKHLNSKMRQPNICQLAAHPREQPVKMSENVTFECTIVLRYRGSSGHHLGLGHWYNIL